MQPGIIPLVMCPESGITASRVFCWRTVPIGSSMAVYANHPGVPACDLLDLMQNQRVLAIDGNHPASDAASLPRAHGYQKSGPVDGDFTVAIPNIDAQVELEYSEVVRPDLIPATTPASQVKMVILDVQGLFAVGYSSDAIPQDGRLGPDVLFFSNPYRSEPLARKCCNLLEERIPV